MRQYPEKPNSDPTIQLSTTPHQQTKNEEEVVVARWQCFGAVYYAWLDVTNLIHRAILTFVLVLSKMASEYPIACVSVVSFLSITILAAGLSTNFTTSLDPEKVFTPFNSRAESHSEWLNNYSGFPDTKTRPFYVLIHQNGNTILTRDATEKLFDALDVIQSTAGYDAVCAQGDHIDLSGESRCWFSSATRHWNHNKTKFLSEMSSDQDVLDKMSLAEYPGGTPVALGTIIGKYDKDKNSGKLLSAQSYGLYLKLPESAIGVQDLEIALNENLMKLREDVASDPSSSVRLEFSSPRSLQDEVVRALEKDLPLIPLVFIVITTFACLVFFRRHKIQSRCMLGFGAIITICMSIMTSFGLMFCFGIPFSVITQILPFVIFGIGLDDTFIITGSFFRTDPSQDTVKRIQESMEDIGMSISLTTITTMVAFLFSSLSTIQAVRWLGLYAFTAIFIDFIYQITYFVAILVLDEHRVQAKRRDVFICFRASDDNVEDNGKDSKGCNGEENPVEYHRITERLMIWYSEKLLSPISKAIVLILFAGFFVICAYSATQLTQEFRSEDFVPDDSYVRDFAHVLDEYYSFSSITATYFRDIDQSDPNIQQQMMDYVDEFGSIEQIGVEPPFCWVVDFHKFQLAHGSEMFNLTFNEQLDIALANPSIREVYGDDIVRDPSTGDITASRCWFLMGNLKIDDVEDQIKFLNDQRALSASEPINEGRNDWSFFSFTAMYFVWEFYAAIEYEMIFTTVAGVIAVTLISFIMISHWSAPLFVLPLIIVLYIDVLGTLQLLGLSVNSMTFVCIVISVGLLVDFLMHVLLRYYESPGETRDDKVKYTLQTMGSSIVVGGLSTFLGILPLAFSTSVIVRTVFISFFAMVTVGCTHGVILLPVLLSIIGPTSSSSNIICEEIDGSEKEKGTRKESHDLDSSLSSGDVESNCTPMVENIQSIFVSKTAFEI